MAASAQRISPMLSVASAGAIAMPMLALMVAVTASSDEGLVETVVQAVSLGGGLVGSATDEHGREFVSRRGGRAGRTGAATPAAGR